MVTSPYLLDVPTLGLGRYLHCHAVPEVLAWAPPTGTLRVESATSCCQVAIGRVDALAAARPGEWGVLK